MSLAESVKIINGKIKSTFEPGIVVLKALGNFDGEFYSKIFFDERKGIYRQTEIAEFYEALSEYKKDASLDNQVNALIEAGDILYYRELLFLNPVNSERLEAEKLFVFSLKKIYSDLNKEGLDTNLVLPFSEIKYSSRASRHRDGLYPAKNKDLELALCKEYLLKEKI